jgi:transcriptional regulator GlxA family with amidase domain
VGTKYSSKLRNLPLNVGILIFDKVEVLDVAGPFEVFSVTRLDEKLRLREQSPFKVILISEQANQVMGVGGMRFTPNVTIHNSPDLDVLIIPGGWGTRSEVKNDNLLRWIAHQASRALLTASICTGSSLLGKAGLLDGVDATTHWRAFDFLRESAPLAMLRRDVRFTLKEPIFTSAGVSAGIDLALRIVSHFFGSKIGRATASQMEYPYPQKNSRK